MSDNRRCRFLTSCGSNVPLRSRGTWDRTDVVSNNRLRPRAITGITATAADQVVLVVAKMLIQLFVDSGLNDLSGQRLQQTTGASQSDTSILGLTHQPRDHLTLSYLQLSQLFRRRQ